MDSITEILNRSTVAPSSEVLQGGLRVKRDVVHEPLSWRLYNLNWNEYFPFNLNHESAGAPLCVVSTSYSAAMEFMKTNFKSIYQDSYSGGFAPEDYGRAKHRYYSEAGDFFLVKDGEMVVGAYVGTPIDWSSYYIRNCSLLPSHQGKKIFQKLLKHILDILRKHDIERVETEISPSNLVNVHVFNKLQFNISGINLSERWGSLLRFSRFLSPKHERIFLDQFCYGKRPQIQNVSAE